MAHLASYLALVDDAERRLIDAFEQIGTAHASEAEVVHTSRLLSDLSRQHLAQLEPIRVEQLGQREQHAEHEPQRFFIEPAWTTRTGPIGLLRDLQDLLVLATFVNSTWTIVDQGAKAARDDRLQALCELASRDNEMQARWLRTAIKSAAPQALMLAQ